ncbi:hypothetical protein TNCV_629101 [Trichonephila clavipes]|nr:hypothetical protein TNCV_629101 [Trichonephila clavipes]
MCTFDDMVHIDSTLSTQWNVLQDKVDQSRSEADAAMESKDQARDELNELLQKVQSLYLKCTSDMKTKPSTDQKDEEETDESVVSEKEETVDKLQDEEIDDSNAVDFNENFERKILELLTLLEYIRMKERGEVEKEPQLGQDEDEPIIEEPPEVDYLDTISPRSLRSKIDLQCLSDLHHTSDALPLDQLKSKAVTAVSEIESGLSSTSEGRRKKD